jgi:hypothetical protein
MIVTPCALASSGAAPGGKDMAAKVDAPAVIGNRQYGLAGFQHRIRHDLRHVGGHPIGDRRIEDDDVRQCRALLQQRRDEAGSINPAPGHVFRLKPRPYPSGIDLFPLLRILKQHQFGVRIIFAARQHRDLHDVEAGQVAGQASGQVQRSLQPRFLTGIIMDEQEHVLHVDFLMIRCWLSKGRHPGIRARIIAAMAIISPMVMAA